MVRSLLDYIRVVLTETAYFQRGGTLAIEIFNLTFAFDMAGITLEEVSNGNDVVIQYTAS